LKSGTERASSLNPGLVEGKFKAICRIALFFAQSRPANFKLRKYFAQEKRKCDAAAAAALLQQNLSLSLARHCTSQSELIL
jgi:hypothetical protein